CSCVLESASYPERARFSPKQMSPVTSDRFKDYSHVIVFRLLDRGWQPAPLLARSIHSGCTAYKQVRVNRKLIAGYFSKRNVMAISCRRQAWRKRSRDLLPVLVFKNL